jgi:hypothetical protein
MKTTTSTTITIDRPILLSTVPNFHHPVFQENPDRAEGVLAALYYLGRKRVDVEALFGKCIFKVVWK